ncbi:dTMP kinase [Candidatus Epulonipiscium fishelsonii]|uniref:dTMP kinase n=1 Tax=Candidatus Epulonipiscium fishelsonii TaxID=77094 RepID=A0ACC8XBZ6_9FIRM|nr:dTMP kinase [Epulopiscium sp. SCG-B05WGA-EpuloA1]ONI40023.1 dTMP kinase [Epulopiscium sp. SCG-B11WGA-EpuloA1]
MRGLFIALEGLDGSGKSFTATELKKSLEHNNYKVILTREPGGLPSAEAIRNTIMDYDIDPKTELLLYLAARRENLLHNVIPYLEQGYIVLCDRFFLSSIVYQGYARGLGMQEVRNLNHFVCDIYPDINIFIDTPIEICMERKRVAKDTNRFDFEKEQFHKKVKEGYEILLNQNQDNIFIVDGSLDVAERVDIISKIMVKYLCRIDNQLNKTKR